MIKINLYETKYEIKRRLEKLYIKFIWKLPRSLVMWCVIRVIAHASTGKWSNEVVGEIKAMDALKRWDDQSV